MNSNHKIEKAQYPSQRKTKTQPKREAYSATPLHRQVYSTSSLPSRKKSRKRMKRKKKLLITLVEVCSLIFRGIRRRVIVLRKERSRSRVVTACSAILVLRATRRRRMRRRRVKLRLIQVVGYSPTTTTQLPPNQPQLLQDYSLISRPQQPTTRLPKSKRKKKPLEQVDYSVTFFQTPTITLPPEEAVYSRNWINHPSQLLATPVPPTIQGYSPTLTTTTLLLEPELEQLYSTKTTKIIQLTTWKLLWKKMKARNQQVPSSPKTKTRTTPIIIITVWVYSTKIKITTILLQ